MSVSQVTSEELSRRIEDERAAIHAEYEQERIAYQKLLKDYNRQEAQLENLQDQMMGSHENRSVSNMSFLDSELDLESAYGSTSARSSFRSRTGPPSVATTVAAGDAAASATAEGADSAAVPADVGLTLKLQQKLKGCLKDRNY